MYLKKHHENKKTTNLKRLDGTKLVNIICLSPFINYQMDSPASLGYQKEKLSKNLKNKVTCLRCEPATSCVAIGYSNQKERTNQEFQKKN